MVHCSITPVFHSPETPGGTYWLFSFFLSLFARFSVPPGSSTFSSPAGGREPVRYPSQGDWPLDIWATGAFEHHCLFPRVYPSLHITYTKDKHFNNKTGKPVSNPQPHDSHHRSSLFTGWAIHASGCNSFCLGFFYLPYANYSQKQKTLKRMIIQAKQQGLRGAVVKLSIYKVQVAGSSFR